MKKFKEVINKYSGLGISLENIEYAIDAIKCGTKRELIIESLTADYRGMTHHMANTMLNELYSVHGGEFKKENRGGYVYGILFLLTGLTCACVVYIANKEAKDLYYQQLARFSNYNSNIHYKKSIPRVVRIYAYAGPIIGIFYLVKAFLGKYRDNHQPF